MVHIGDVKERKSRTKRCKTGATFDSRESIMIETPYLLFLGDAPDQLGGKSRHWYQRLAS